MIVVIKEMRVVAGVFKGRPLKAVPGKSTRPTTDKVKEAIFNMIGPYFEGGLCLDLYAGSGGLGIEAISRGAEKVIFVDHDKIAIQTIYDNLKAVAVEEQCEVYRNDANRALKAITKRELTFDYIFLDPPYARQKLSDMLSIIAEQKLLKEDGMIVCEHDSKFSLPEQIDNLRRVKVEAYGIITVSLYRSLPLHEVEED